MDRLFNSIANSLTEIWRNIGLSQKVSIILIFIVAISLAITGILYSLRTDWGILYSNLDEDTAAQVTNVIQENGIKYKFENGGRRILVPVDSVSMLKIRCASTGITTKEKGSGFELFDNAPLGLTDRQQQVMWLRGKQGELQRQINEIPDITGSRVLLSFPERTVFSRKKKRPSASVMLVIKKGRMLNPEQVTSIKYLVASSVTDMTPSDITITDNMGRLLSRKEYDGVAGGGGNSAMEMKSKMEYALKEKIESVLRPIIGIDNVVAQVSCDVDFNSIDRITESYDAEQAVVISEKTTIDDSSRMNPSSSGAAGLSANKQVRGINPNANSKNKSSDKMFSEQRKTSELKYVVPKVVEKQIVKGGKIKSLSVAVTIAQKEGAKPRTAEQLAALKILIGNAVGINNYGSNVNTNPISIIEMPFISTEPAATTPISFLTKIESTIEKLKSSSLISMLGGFILLILLWIVFKRYFNRTMVSASDLANNNIEYSNQDYIAANDLESMNTGSAMNNIEGDDGQLVTFKLKTPISAKELATALDTVNTKDVADVLENWIASEA